MNLEDGKIIISIYDGESSDMAYMNIEFPIKNYPEFYTKDFCRKLLISILNLAPVEHAVILSDTLKSKIPKIEKILEGIYYILSLLFKYKWNKNTERSYIIMREQYITCQKMTIAQLVIRTLTKLFKIADNKDSMDFLKNILK